MKLVKTKKIRNNVIVSEGRDIFYAVNTLPPLWIRFKLFLQLAKLICPEMVETETKVPEVG